jgi:DNA-binding beta-propeller fold protein YncE
LVSTGLASADSVLSTVKVGNQPFTPLADPSNGHVYVPNTNSSSISVISGTGDVATSG